MTGNDKNSKGFGFVNFKELKNPQETINKMNKHIIENKRLLWQCQ